MSKEMSLFKNGADVPAYLTGGASDLTRGLAGGGNIKRISIKGGVFRMMAGGRQVALNEERSMNFIVIDAAPAISRTYYDGQYVEGEDATPVCWSDDGNAPSVDAPKPQSKTCAMCPQNVKGSGQGESCACRFSQRLAVVLEGDMEGGVYGIQLPAMSVFGQGVGRYSPLQDYARKLASFNVSLERVVTEFRFDTQAQVPKLFFQAVRPLTQDEYQQVQALQEEDNSALVGPRTFPKPQAAASAAVSETGDDDEAPAPAPAAKKVRSKKPEPTVREAAKPAPAEPTESNDDALADLLEEWADD